MFHIKTFVKSIMREEISIFGQNSQPIGALEISIIFIYKNIMSIT